jgi:hypothetical protein
MEIAQVEAAKNVVVRMEGRTFTVEIDIADEDLITAIISVFGLFIKRGVPVRVVQFPAQTLSRSQTIFSRLLTSFRDLANWLDDFRRLLRVHRGICSSSAQYMTGPWANLLLRV